MIPNLPTDNLYKFIALSGVLLAVFCIYSINTSMTEVARKATKLEMETLEMKVDAELLKERIQELHIELNHLDSILDLKELEFDNQDLVEGNLFIKLKNKNYRDYYKFIIDYRENIQPEYRKHLEISNTNSEIALLNDEQYKSSIILDRKLKLLERYNDEVERNLYRWFTGLVLSLIIAGVGFYMWYFKVQRFLDLKVSHDYEQRL